MFGLLPSHINVTLKLSLNPQNNAFYFYFLNICNNELEKLAFTHPFVISQTLLLPLSVGFSGMFFVYIKNLPVGLNRASFPVTNDLEI